MARATWNGAVLAESDEYELVEGNVYFPPSALKREHLRESTHESFCFWKGQASYFDVVVGDAVNANAAWYYAEPMDAAKNITGLVAFWNGVQVER